MWIGEGVYQSFKFFFKVLTMDAVKFQKMVIQI